MLFPLSVWFRLGEKLAIDKVGWWILIVSWVWWRPVLLNDHVYFMIDSAELSPSCFTSLDQGADENKQVINFWGIIIRSGRPWIQKEGRRKEEARFTSHAMNRKLQPPQGRIKWWRGGGVRGGSKVKNSATECQRSPQNVLNRSPKWLRSISSHSCAFASYTLMMQTFLCLPVVC